MNGVKVTSPSEGARAVRARYSALREIVSSVRDRPASSSGDVLAASSMLAYEGRLLDEGDLETWLALWCSDSVLWVPLCAEAGPDGDQSLLLDDRTRLGERVRWLQGSSTWARTPVPSTVRLIGSVEAWPDSDALITRSALLLTEHRGGRTSTLAGHQIHRLVPSAIGSRAGWSIACKILLLPALRCGATNLASLL